MDSSQDISSKPTPLKNIFGESEVMFTLLSVSYRIVTFNVVGVAFALIKTSETRRSVMIPVISNISKLYCVFSLKVLFFVFFREGAFPFFFVFFC